MVTPLDHASVEAVRPRTALRFCLTAFAGSVAMFMGWCLQDYLLVRFAPSRIHNFDWVLLLLPIAVAFASAAAFRHVNAAARVSLSIASAILASVAAVLLVFFFGVPFHFSIGGQL